MYNLLSRVVGLAVIAGVAIFAAYSFRGEPDQLTDREVLAEVTQKPRIVAPEIKEEEPEAAEQDGEDAGPAAPLPFDVTESDEAEPGEAPTQTADAAPLPFELPSGQEEYVPSEEERLSALGDGGLVEELDAQEAAGTAERHETAPLPFDVADTKPQNVPTAPDAVPATQTEPAAETAAEHSAPLPFPTEDVTDTEPQEVEVAEETKGLRGTPGPDGKPQDVVPVTAMTKNKPQTDKQKDSPSFTANAKKVDKPDDGTYFTANEKQVDKPDDGKYFTTNQKKIDKPDSGKYFTANKARIDKPDDGKFFTDTDKRADFDPCRKADGTRYEGPGTAVNPFALDNPCLPKATDQDFALAEVVTEPLVNDPSSEGPYGLPRQPDFHRPVTPLPPSGHNFGSDYRSL